MYCFVKVNNKNSFYKSKKNQWILNLFKHQITTFVLTSRLTATVYIQPAPKTIIKKYKIKNNKFSLLRQHYPQSKRQPIAGDNKNLLYNLSARYQVSRSSIDL